MGKTDKTGKKEKTGKKGRMERREGRVNFVRVIFSDKEGSFCFGKCVKRELIHVKNGIFVTANW